MDVNINRNITNEPQEDFSIDFEVERTPVRLGKSDRYFYIDFNDTNFPARLMQARKEIADYIDQNQKELDSEYGADEIEKAMKISKEIDDYIKDKINYIFGYNVSEDVFGIASSTSVTRKGEYYFENFLNAVIPLIEREYGVRIKATNERVKSYTDRKGMHPALKK